jgi:hypothetical protein
VEDAYAVDAGDIGPRGAQAGAAQHVLAYVLLELDTRLALTLGDHFTLESLVPVEIAAVNARFVDEQGNRIEGLDEGHHRGTIVALGDPQVSGRVRIVGTDEASAVIVDVRFGLALPLGTVETNPFRAGARGESHEHIFFGRGTLDPLLGVQASLPVDDLRVFGYAWTRLSLYDASTGFRGGDRYSGGAGVELGPDDVRVRSVCSVYHQAVDRWDGTPSPESVSKTDVAFTGAVRLSSSTEWPVEISFTVPLTVHASGGIDHNSPSVLSVTLEHAFRL